MTTSPPLDWIKKIDEALLTLDERPQFGLPETFPLEQVEALFQKRFDHPNLTLKVEERGWATGDQVWDGLGEHLFPLKLEMTPLEDPFYFVLSQQDLAELMSDLLGGDSASAPFYDPDLTAGFYHYLALEVLQTIEEVKFAQPLSPRLGEIPKDIKAEISGVECCLVDVVMTLEKKSVWGRLLIPAPFRKGLKTHFAAATPPELSDEARTKMSVTLSLLVGYAGLTLDDYKGMSAGDYVILDRCSYNPDENKGTVTLVLGEQPLFRGKIKKEHVEILEYPRYEEVEMEDEEVVEGEEVEASEEVAAEVEAVEEEEQASLEVDQLPVNLTIEVGRVRMTVQELSNLSPGNLINLDVAPEQGVNLIISGKKVGRGELVRVGETLGVRILTI